MQVAPRTPRVGEMTRQASFDPLGAISDAVRSTFGGLATLWVGLAAGTWAGQSVLYGYGYFGWPEQVADWLAWSLVFFFPIALACLEVWGLFYVCLVAWFAHALVHDEAPRLRTGGLIVLAQFACAVIAHAIADGGFDAGALRRLAVGGPVVVVFALSPLAAGRFMGRRRAPGRSPG